MMKAPYRGLVAEVARKLGKRQPNVYAAIFYTDTPNAEKDMFMELKKDREERYTRFKESLKKAV